MKTKCKWFNQTEGNDAISVDQLINTADQNLYRTPYGPMPTPKKSTCTVGTATTFSHNIKAKLNIISANIVSFASVWFQLKEIRMHNKTYQNKKEKPITDLIKSLR